MPRFPGRFAIWLTMNKTSCHRQRHMVFKNFGHANVSKTQWTDCVICAVEAPADRAFETEANTSVDVCVSVWRLRATNLQHFVVRLKRKLEIRPWGFGHPSWRFGDDKDTRAVPCSKTPWWHLHNAQGVTRRQPCWARTHNAWLLSWFYLLVGHRSHERTIRHLLCEVATDESRSRVTRETTIEPSGWRMKKPPNSFQWNTTSQHSISVPRVGQNANNMDPRTRSMQVAGPHLRTARGETERERERERVREVRSSTAHSQWTLC